MAFDRAQPSPVDWFASGRPTCLYGMSYGTQLVLCTLVVAQPRRLSGVILGNRGFREARLSPSKSCRMTTK